ncbi:MAG: TIGR01906 family membrane protein [Chloroflexi bacterium]|nr:TIGR01906 family membrane protein [Chloroflexota bacterium]
MTRRKVATYYGLRKNKVLMLKRVLHYLFVLAVPILLLTSTIRYVANSPWFYAYGFDKYDVSGETGIAKDDLPAVARGLISYFNSSAEPISLEVTVSGRKLPLFNQREVVHLKDVKDLIRKVYRVQTVALIFVAAYVVGSFWWQRKTWGRDMAQGLFLGGVLTLTLLVALGMGALLDFDALFLQFHLLSFANDFWQLDPSRDRLIQMFPQGFFFDATMFIAGAVVVEAALLIGIAGAYLKLIKRKVGEITY